MTPVFRPVVVCGGLGTRLAPISTRKVPKPVAKGVPNPQKSQLQETVERLQNLGAPLLITDVRFREFVEADLPGVDVVYEPEPKGTGAAVTTAAKRIVSEHGMDALMGVFWVDGRFDPLETYLAAIRRAQTAAVAERDKLILLLVKPDWANPGLGYAKCGKVIDSQTGICELTGFRYHPGAEAEALVAAGAAWNVGNFVSPVRTFLAALEDCAPQHLEPFRGLERGFSEDAVRKAYAAVRTGFTIDEAVLQPFAQKWCRGLVWEGRWSDIGTLPELRRYVTLGPEGCDAYGAVEFEGCSDCFGYNASPDKKLRLRGLRGITVVYANDNLLVVQNERSSYVGDFYEYFEKRRPGVIVAAEGAGARIEQGMIVVSGQG